MAAKTCSVCSNPWNRGDHLPVALPACGHSFCRSCLAMMYSNDKCIKCPTCRKVYKDIRPEDLPANFALLDLIESNVQDGRAPNPGSPDVPPSGSPSEPPKADPAPRPGSPDVPPSGSPSEPPKADPAPSPGSPDVKPSGSPSEPPKGDPDDDPPSGPSKRGLGKGLLIGCATVVGGVGAVAAAPAVLTAVGFTSAGIAAGSWAASMMSIAAGLNGGGVAAGGLIATLQSVGAAGLGATGIAAVGAAGGAAGAGVAAVRMKSRL